MGLSQGDLKDLVKKTFDIDTYSSKMGEDKNIVTISFDVSSELPAKDLVKFLEAGYHFILDSAVSSGEQDDGHFRVFSEIARDKSAINHILEILSGVEKLTDCNDYKFRYYKNFKSVPATEENLTKQVITDPDRYGVDLKVAENHNIDNFFKKSFLDSIKIDENILTLKKVYSDPIQFNVIDFATHNEVHANLTESYNFNDFGEIIFMVKYLGDYDITKYGNKLIIENNGYCLVAERL